MGYSGVFICIKSDESIDELAQSLEEILDLCFEPNLEGEHGHKYSFFSQDTKIG